MPMAEYILPVKPSPNLPTQHAVVPGRKFLCLFEGTVVSVGRAPCPFEVYQPNRQGTPFTFYARSTLACPFTCPMKTKPVWLGPPATQRQPGHLIKIFIGIYSAYPEKDKFFYPTSIPLRAPNGLKRAIMSWE